MISKRKATALRARNERYNAWSKQFTKPNGWTVITKEEQATCPANARMTNEQRSELEIFDFYNSPPVHYSGYAKTPDGNAAPGSRIVVTNWMGEPLGVGTIKSVWRHNFGGRMLSAHIKTTDGRVYGVRWAFKSMDLCRLRLTKRQSVYG